VAKKLSSKDTFRESKTSSRTDLVDAALAAIRRLGTEVDGLDQRAAGHFGISRTDLHLIDRLRSEGPQTPSELARSVGLTSGGLSIALERLERIGYIRRSQHPEDRRSVLVEATEAIFPLENQVFGPLIRDMRSVLATYDDRNLATIRDYLDRAAAVISQSGPGASPAPDGTTVRPATSPRSEPGSHKQARKPRGQHMH
jgi:DNA-binding MarR family transcriptional regulator